MKKIIVSVLGHDRPGIIAAASGVLMRSRCNIEDVSQTILQTEFVGAFLASRPEECGEDELLAALRGALGPMGLSVLIKPVEEHEEWTSPESEPFVITTMGPDRVGLVSGITEVLARFRGNITNLKAVFRGGENPEHNVMIYEVDIPVGADQQAFRAALQERAGELGLSASLQHRDIFETIHKV